MIGDIHGCFDELRQIVEFLLDERDFNDNDLLVFVGDYIDRGPDSRAVIQYLIDFSKKHPNTIFLKGNHEDMLLSYLGYGGNMGASYVPNGGMQTLQNYGFSESEFALPDEGKMHIPEDHINFFLNLDKYLLISDEYAIAHAGFSPYRAIDAQVEEDLLWVRDEFISSDHFFDRTIIFGHTPYHDIYFDLPQKIGIDTGLVYGNMLTCIELLKGEIFQIGLGGTDIFVSNFEEKGAFVIKIDEE